MSDQQPKTEHHREAAEKTPRPFPPQKTFEELAAEQGVDLNGQYERLLGSGKGLWDSDEDFDDFVAQIYRWRRESLPPEERDERES